MITQMLLAGGAKYKAEIFPTYSVTNASNFTSYSWGSVNIGSPAELRGRKRYLVIVSTAGTQSTAEALIPNTCTIDGDEAIRVAVSSNAYRHAIGVFVKEIADETSVSIVTTFQTYANSAGIQVFTLYAHDYAPTFTDEISINASGNVASIDSSIDTGGVALYAAVVDTGAGSLTWSNVDTSAYDRVSDNYRFCTAYSVANSKIDTTVGFTTANNQSYRRLLGCSWR